MTLFAAAGPLPFDSSEALEHLSRVEPRFRPLLRRVELGLRVARRFSPYEALGTSILYQQLNGTAAAAIASRLREVVGGGRFPSAEELLAAPERSLREVGLSRMKALALKDLAARSLDGTVPGARALGRMEDEEIIERLTKVRGVGRWTVEMLLIFRLGRPDVLPVHDYGVRKGFTRLFGLRELVPPKELYARGEAWRPFRTVASWYLWRVLEQPDGR